MSVNIAAIKKYLMPLDTVSLQMLQRDFLLSYSEVVKIISELERQDAVSFVSGFTYKVHKKCIIAWDGVPGNGKKLNAIDDSEEMLIKALRECIKSDNVSASGLQRKLSIGYAFAARLVERLGELELINYHERKVLVTAKEFNARFGGKYKIDTYQ